MIKVEKSDDGTLCIGLDRASKRNAIGVEMTLMLRDLLAQTKHDPSIHTLIFYGVGGHFCAGMDMKDFFDSTSRPADELKRAREATEHWRVHLLRDMPQTMITAVEGYCLGAAFPIVAASDIVVAAQDARFGLPEINFGFVPGGQILQFAGTRMTPRAIRYAALTGRLFDAAQARQWGLITEVVEQNPLSRALEISQTLTARTRSGAFSLPESRLD